ncbi:hypothetical protein [Persephonella sp. KM09-Lau-8]|uniref:hypothetical protein n=1 Tax=Persephonella sp. KM09-Lau-8 TaxID=1158345 RepID=UPI0004960E97|nr:hypothetical protein [Persephonella sp. KM09-Lau-8]
MLTIDGKSYEIQTKKELESPVFQKILSVSYWRKKKKGIPVDIHCGCKTSGGSHIPLYIIRLKSNGHYYLRTQGGYSRYHEEDCVFSPEGPDSFVKEEDGRIELKSFRLLLDAKSRKATRIINHFLFVLADISYAESFVELNKGRSRISGSILNPFVSFFEEIFRKNLKKTKISSGTAIGNLLVRKNVGVKIDVVTHLYKKDKNSSYYYYRTVKNGNKEFFIPKDILYAGNGNVKLRGNFIKPPYLLIKIYSQREKKVYRFFLLPIADRKHFIPVESQKERDFIQGLLKDKVGLYKPMTTLTMGEILGLRLSDKFSKVSLPDARPDVFVFREGKIEVIEIVDSNVLKTDMAYKKRLEKKEEAYKKLPEPFVYSRAVL